MSKRSAVGVFFFAFFLSIFYQIYWFVQTKKEMTELGCKIPTSWLMIIPFVSFYWDWKYSEAVESVSLERYSAGFCFFIIQLKLIIAVILIVIFIAVHDSSIDSKEYYRAIGLIAGAVPIAILQSMFNKIKDKEPDQ